MQPEARERFTGDGFRLRDFVFVMRKDQVDAAGMDVQSFAKIFHGHHGAFDVPAGTAGADLAIPEWLVVLGRLPQHKIAGVGFVVLVTVHSGAGADAAEIVVRKLAVLRELRNPVIYRAVASIGVSALLELLDGVDHFLDVFSGLHHAFRPFQAQRRAVFEKSFGVLLGVFRKRFVLGRGVANDLVFHVGDVHDVVKLIAARPQPTAQDILESERAKVSDMYEVIDRWAARIHADGRVVKGRKRLHLLR